MIKSARFKSLLSADERKAWLKITEVIRKFLGNRRAVNYKKIVSEMTSSLAVIGVNMSYKIHLLDNHVDSFPPNCGQYSDERGISTFECRYKGKNPRHMLAEYCWSLCRKTNVRETKRKIDMLTF